MRHWEDAMQQKPAVTSVLFSSIAAVFGSPGQANYASANSALDGMAAKWQEEGHSSVSICWGAWSGGGMASQDAQSVSRMERMGLGMLTVDQGLAALHGVMLDFQVKTGDGNDSDRPSITCLLLIVLPASYPRR